MHTSYIISVCTMQCYKLASVAIELVLGHTRRRPVFVQLFFNTICMNYQSPVRRFKFSWWTPLLQFINIFIDLSLKGFIWGIFVIEKYRVHCERQWSSFSHLPLGRSGIPTISIRCQIFHMLISPVVTFIKHVSIPTASLSVYLPFSYQPFYLPKQFS